MAGQTPAFATGLPSRDVSFHGEFWRVSGPNAGVLSTAALDPPAGRLSLAAAQTVALPHSASRNFLF
jgi:hypothetical protein